MQKIIKIMNQEWIGIAIWSPDTLSDKTTWETLLSV